MAVVDGNVVSIALPTITRFFHTTLANSQWTITAYLISMTSFLLIFGRISEFLGNSRVFIFGSFVFTLSSLLCGLSTGLPMLILMRVIQGIGAAMLFSISAAMIFSTSEPNERGRAMGLIGAVVASGSIAGPVLGGFLVQSLGWEYIFLINVPIGVVLTLISMAVLQNSPVKNVGTFDFLGSFLLIVFMVSLMLFLGSFAEDFNISLFKAISGILAVIGGALFYMYEKKNRDPLIDLSIFQKKEFLLPNLSMILYFFASFMLGIIGPFYFEGVMHFSPAQVGTIFLIVPAVMVIGSPVTGLIYDRYPWEQYAALGLLITMISFLLLGYAAFTENILAIILIFIIYGLGSALFQSPNNVEIMSSLSADKLSIASSVTATLRNLGMALGVSFASILITFQIFLIRPGTDIIEADELFIASIIANILYIAGLLVLLGAIISYIGNRNCQVRVLD